jgi:hypothetical protein
METLRKRFHYRRPGLWVLGVRVFHSNNPLTIVPTAEQLGCKSWVTFDPPLATEGLRPALDDLAWDDQLRSLLAAVEPGRQASLQANMKLGRNA